jgi:1,4-alpha-glucan branching enzyme
MRRHFLSYLTVPLLLVGCAPNHVVVRSNDEVQLVLWAPDARTVLLASSLNGFSPQPTSPEQSGRWVTTQPATGNFSYFYLVDGRAHVPDCRDREWDDFGGSNCLYQP